MRVKPEDGRCRSCSGELEIVDADECSLFVECEECGDTYEMEPDAFRDGCMTYYVAFMIQKLRNGGGQ